MQKEEKDLRDRTKAFAVRIVRMFSALPKTTEAQVLGKQLLRSGTSIGANYREAFRARSKAEFIAKCGDSLREIEEWSVLGNRDKDGTTREVAGELMGKQRVKAPTGWSCSWNPGLSAWRSSHLCDKNGASEDFLILPSSLSFLSSLHLVHQRIPEERQETRDG